MTPDVLGHMRKTFYSGTCKPTVCPPWLQNVKNKYLTGTDILGNDLIQKT